MKSTRWKLFSYLVMDRRAAQAWLNQMAAEGWALEHIYLGQFARFRATDRTDLTYFLDWVNPQFPDTPDYLQLCADAGWEPVQTLDYLNLYASRPGASPDPIQTDPALEYQRFQKKVLQHMALGVAVLVGMLLLSFLSQGGPFRIGGWSWRETAAILLSGSFSGTFALLCAPVWLAGWLAYLAALLRRVLLWRAAAREGRLLPDPDPKQVRIWGVVRFLGHLSLGAVALLLLADALLNGFGALSSAIGIFLGSGLGCLINRDNPPLARRGLLALGWAAALILCLRLNGPLRAEFSGRMPPAPLLEQALVTDADRSDTIWGSRARWQERPSEANADASAALLVEAQTWTSPALAQWAFGPIPEDMEAVPGHPGMWRGTSDRDGENTYLLRREQTQITLRAMGTFSQDPLPAALAWLERV